MDINYRGSIGRVLINGHAPLFLQRFLISFKQTNRMEQTRKHKGFWWLVFFISTAALVIAILAHWEWLTLILPFQTTAFVKAMNLM